MAKTINAIISVGFSLMVLHHYRLSFAAPEYMAVIGGSIAAFGIILSWLMNK